LPGLASSHSPAIFVSQVAGIATCATTANLLPEVFMRQSERKYGYTRTSLKKFIHNPYVHLVDFSANSLNICLMIAQNDFMKGRV
jgi:hypothetical protein